MNACIPFPDFLGVEVVGITLSEPQARIARERAERAGVGERVEIRVMDYRDIADGPFDGIASIGMVEHVGGERIELYAERLVSLLEPGGRLLNHGIARLRHSDPEAGPFFYEVIQRKGDRGFGAGNFRALFESIEGTQRAEGRI